MNDKCHRGKVYSFKRLDRAGVGGPRSSDPLPNTIFLVLYIFEMYLRQEVGGIVVFD